MVGPIVFLLTAGFHAFVFAFNKELVEEFDWLDPFRFLAMPLVAGVAAAIMSIAPIYFFILSSALYYECKRCQALMPHILYSRGKVVHL